MDEDCWATLIAAATERANCAQADCRVNWIRTPWYADYEHLDNTPHKCPACSVSEYPRYLVSVHTLMTLPREVLTARLSLWLSHHHQNSADTLGAALGTPDSLASGGASSTPNDRTATVAATASGIADAGSGRYSGPPPDAGY